MIKRAVPLLFCVAASAGAQARRSVPPPTPAEQKATVAQLRANLTGYDRHPPAFACVQPTTAVSGAEALRASPELGSSVIVDLGASPQPAQTGIATTFAVAPLLHDLAAPGVEFTFDHWTLSHRKHAAVYRYKQSTDAGVRQADVYADPDSGAILQIVFRGFTTHASQGIFCQAQAK